MYKSKMYQPESHLKENFMFCNLNVTPFFFANRLKSYSGFNVIAF